MSERVTPAQLIARKRDGDELQADEIAHFVAQFSAGHIPDYQMSAFAMAVYFRGMTTAETVALTQALLHSGTILDWPDTKTQVDKHSTGGIGDKISLILAPLLASCGLQVPMLSGRGLGITGGTLDKLESIPGFRTNLSIEELQRITGDVGCVITGASDQLAPADRRLYALRDVTATVPSPPLIVSSIMSKKLAENLSSLVLDVKCGSGAFMKTQEDATSLARALVEVGKQSGVATTALITNMAQPLGQAIGNALEVQEAIYCLQGEGPADVRELTIRLASELLLAERLVDDMAAAEHMLQERLTSGMAYEKFTAMVTAQGGRLDEFKVDGELQGQTVVAEMAGSIQQIDCAAIGNLVVSMGGGRRLVTDSIDHAVGIKWMVSVGDAVEKGQPFACIYSRTPRNLPPLADMVVIKEHATAAPQLVVDRIA